MKQAPLVVVIYDGINNSVFDSQVMHPLIKTLEADPHKKIVLISFEKKEPSQKTIQKKIPDHSSLTFIVCKKLPYIGTLSLYFAAHALKKILKKYSQYDLQARGPLAGFICQKACKTPSCNSLTIQARGLLAEEYAFEHTESSNMLALAWHSFRYSQFYKLERITYSQAATCVASPSIIQSVSKALGEYLITTHDADRTKISIATHDIPPIIAPSQLASWKQLTRNELKIPHDAIVYCYNGSIKAWQCPEQVITYFKQKYQENSKAFLYILTQDKQQFEQLIKEYTLATHSYCVLNVHHNDIYRYLAGADVGLMFRKSHIVNWVSRPTKALEYASVGLTIVHNNTVSWLLEQAKRNSAIQNGHKEIKTAQESQANEALLNLSVAN